MGLPGAVLGEEQIAARFRSKRVLARYDAGEAEAAGCIRAGCGRTGLASILAVQGEDGFADWRAGEGIQDLSLNRGRCLGEDRCGKQEKEKGRADHDSRISRAIDKGAVAPPCGWRKVLNRLVGSKFYPCARFVQTLVSTPANSYSACPESAPFFESKCEAVQRPKQT